MTRKVVFTAPATVDAREIHAFGIQSFGQRTGKAYVQGLRAACKKLGDFPALGRRHPTFVPPTRILVYRRHRIFYRVEPDRVLILRVLHHARATPTVF